MYQRRNSQGLSSGKQSGGEAHGIYEYDEEATRQAIRVEEYERGREDGIEQGIKALILDNIENGFVKEVITAK